ncbi:MAG: hypothetical protein IKS32_06220 [Solobacterium sp.]|nr:hypothetical protein [Solobacterium sp.]
MKPIRLVPIYDKTIWAGNRLAKIRGREACGEGTVWEISVHPYAQSVIQDGDFEGRTLASLIEEQKEAVLGPGVEEADLLRCAFLDAKDALSVQVHPGERYARTHSDDHGKTESWYILDADKGASLVAGSDFQNREQIAEAIETGTIEDHLTHMPVQEGDFILVPSGTLHALGAGILALEIGTNSNVTYRFYDYHRKDANGNERALQLAESLDTVVCGQKGIRIRTDEFSPKKKRVAEFPEYTVDLIDIDGEFTLFSWKESFRTLSCVKGEAHMTMDGEDCGILHYTESVFLPAECGDLILKGRCRILVGTPRPHGVMRTESPAYNQDFSMISEGVSLSRGVKKLKDLAGYFRDVTGADPDTVLYEVQCDDGDPEVSGSLSYGLTTLYPVLINGECAFTKGHWHTDETCEEIYAGESGAGLLMLMDHDGRTWCEAVFPGSVHHIRGNLAHRLINTGEEPLKVRAVWPPSAGHNYQAVEEQPFGFRVFRKENEIKVIPYEQL